MPCSYCLGLLVHNMFEFHTLLFLFIFIFFFKKGSTILSQTLLLGHTKIWESVSETNYIAPIFHICHIHFLINNSWKLLSSIWKSRFIFLVPLKMKKIRNVVSCNLQHLFIVFLLRLLSIQIISRMVQIRPFKPI